jgi:acyl transferase domain-containing protein
MVMNLVRHQQENIPDEYLLLSKIGQLWLFGVAVDWRAFYRQEERYRVPLPTYPFEKRRYWFDGDVIRKMTEMQSRPGDGYDAEPEPTPEPEQAPAITPDEYEYETGEEYAAPRDELEQKIAQIWQDQLGFKKIGIYDNFFRLNGDSLTATQVVSRIQEMYPVEVTLHDFFEEPTIAHLAEVIKKLLIVKIKNLSPGERKRLAGK